MPVNKKIDAEEKKRAAADASSVQVNDIFTRISNLGSIKPKEKAVNEENSNSFDTERENKQNRIKTVTKREIVKKEDKPGYISLVVSNDLKKKWKLYCAQHGISLTDCVKLGMKLLEEMEKNEQIRIEDGFLVYNN